MNKTVLVTGSSRGIGKAIALKFAKEGYNVVVNCVNNENLLNQTRVEVESYDAVSYTHLDVYKRQVLPCRSHRSPGNKVLKNILLKTRFRPALS